MRREEGMSLLEVLLAMTIFAAVALVLVGSMQGQANAIIRMRNETFGLWVADALLQSSSAQKAASVERKSSTGEITFAYEKWSWRSEISTLDKQQVTQQTLTVTLPGGQTSTLTRYQLLPDATAHEK